MRTWLITLSFAVSFNSIAADETPNLMTTASVTCPQYLALGPGAEKTALESWVIGRVVAIVPATFQHELRKISVSSFRQDLQNFCTGSIPEATLFDASALLAYGYQKRVSASRSPGGRPAPQRPLSTHSGHS